MGRLIEGLLVYDALVCGYHLFLSPTQRTRGEEMNPLLEAAYEVCAFMAERKWKFCIIGGLAVQVWGEPRTTLDADFTLVTGFGREESFVKPILDRFRSRIPDAASFALKHRVILAQTSNGKDIDISLGGLPFENRMIGRAQRVEFAPGLFMPCCSPEDLVIMKAFAGRARDWVDLEGIVTRQEKLDNRYILKNLEALCELKGAPDQYERTKAILEMNPGLSSP